MNQHVAGLMFLALVLPSMVAPASAGAVTIPHDVDFPTTRVGSTSAVTVSFVAEVPAERIGVATLDPSSDFALGVDTCSGRVVDACSIELSFTPAGAGVKTAILRVPGERGNVTVRVTGVAFAAGSQLKASPTVVVFPAEGAPVLSAPRRVVLAAAGDVPVAITAIVIDGASAGDFLITADDCSRSTLSIGSTCTVEVRAVRLQPAANFARLRVIADPSEASLTVGLSVAEFASRTAVSLASASFWSFGVLSAVHRRRRTVVKLFSSYYARVTVRVRRGGNKVVRRKTQYVGPGEDPVTLRGKLSSGRYRVCAAASVATAPPQSQSPCRPMRVP
jgi:hypothetical protein